MSEEILETTQLPTESMDDYKAELEASFKKIRVGDIIECYVQEEIKA